MDRTGPPSAFRRIALRALAATGLGAAILLNWWWKVDDARQPDSIPTAAFGTPVDMGRTHLTPLSLTFADGRIALEAIAENVTGRTQTAVFGIPEHPPTISIGDQALDAPDVKLIRDDTYLSQLQPRMPERVRLIWDAPEGWTPQPVTISFETQRFKLRDNLYGAARWLGFMPAAEMTATPEARP